ncbi:DUF6498-containing protein [Halorubrum sp. SD626R]|uniref:DUF6498-containing protein n=1 Tax=Halorubrum sp. SD626R TaxID=1419722 RepID=UPI000AC40733|nr:DUF6498-containing protein [Halorubrum sp. SD626R]
MRESLPPQTPLSNGTLLSVFVANGIPVVGLLAFDTSAVALLTFYWLELGVLAVWAIVRSLFAGHRPDRRSGLDGLNGTLAAAVRLLSTDGGSENASEKSSSGDGGVLDKRISIPRTDVGIYVGTIPALLFIVPMLAAVWVGFGGFVAGPVIAASDPTSTQAWVLTGAGVVFLSEGGRTVSEYFYHGTHRETSAWAAAKGIFWQGFALTSAGLLVVLLAYESTEGNAGSVESAARGPLIFTAIACKLSIDLASYYLDSRDEPLRELL